MTLQTKDIKIRNVISLTHHGQGHSEWFGCEAVVGHAQVAAGVRHGGVTDGQRAAGDAEAAALMQGLSALVGTAGQFVPPAC